MSSIATNSPSTSSGPMTNARARLWLGISCVGTQVIISIAALSLKLTDRFLPGEALPLGSEFLAAACFFGCIALVLLPFDILGGWILPRRFQAVERSFGSFFVSLLRAVGLQVLLFACLFMAYRNIGSQFGFGAVAATLVMSQLVLTAVQFPLARWVGALRNTTRMPDSVNSVIVEGHDSGFTGGIAGLPGLEVTVMPQLWTDALPTRLQQVATLRRSIAISSGKRLAGLATATVWNTIAVLIALSLPGAGVTSMAALAAGYFYFSLLSFVGLLLLPTYSRKAIFAVDQLTAAEATAGEVIELASQVEELAEKEPNRTAELESVFHPVPCVERRAQTLANSADANGRTWNLARTALFLSWSFGGPLARSVHCNIGRPELWVFLPTD